MDNTNQPMNVTGEISNEGGTIRLSQSSGGDLNLMGDFDNGGDFECRNRAVFCSGTENQTIGGENEISIDFLILNNSEGLTIDREIIVDDQLTLTDGIIDLGTFNLILNDNGGVPLVGGSASSYILISDTGLLTRKNVGATAKLFFDDRDGIF